MKKARNISNLLCVAILFFSIFVFLTSQSAHATATLSLSDGTNSILVADGTGLDLDLNPGVVKYIGKLGNWLNINVTTGSTYPDIGSLSYPVLDLKDVSLEAFYSGTLTLKFSETDFGPTGSANFNTHAWGVTSESVTFNSYFDSTNTLFGQGTSVGTLGPYTAGFNSTATSSGNPSNPYSLTDVATITFGGPVSGTALHMNLSVVPEPISSTLFIIGAATLGFRRYLKREKA